MHNLGLGGGGSPHVDLNVASQFPAVCCSYRGLHKGITVHQRFESQRTATAFSATKDGGSCGNPDGSGRPGVCQH